MWNPGTLARCWSCLVLFMPSSILQATSLLLAQNPLKIHTASSNLPSTCKMRTLLLSKNNHPWQLVLDLSGRSGSSSQGRTAVLLKCFSPTGSGAKMLLVTVVHPCQAATMIGAATTAGHALNFTNEGGGEGGGSAGLSFSPLP